MSDFTKSLTSISSPDLSSLEGSFISEEDRIDSDIEADLLQATIDESATLRTCSPASLQSVQSSKQSSTSVFIRKVLLSSVSSQLRNAVLKGTVGDPSCISFRKYLAIGTSKGVVFIFNLHQVLRLCFGNISPTNSPEAKAGEGQGPITVISQNPTGTLLMSVYRSGRIAVWQIPASLLCDESEQDTIKGRLHDPDDESDSTGTAQHDDINSSQSSLQQEISMAPKKRSSISLTYTSSYGRLLCVINDAHGVDHSVSLCSFTTVSSLAACVDTGGSVFQLKFTKGLVGMKVESMCFFSGSRVEICAMEALGLNAVRSDGHRDPKQLDNQHKAAKLSVLYSSALLAMASFNKFIIVQLRPRIQVAYWQPLKGPPALLPYMNWYWCADSVDKAFIAFGRGSGIQIMQVSRVSGSNNTSVDSLQMTEPNFPDSSTLLRTTASKNDENQLDFKLLYSFSFEQNFLNLKWISYNQVIAVDENEQLYLLSSSTGEILETVDVSNMRLHYNSDLFKYPRISQALAFAGERACMHSLTAYGSQLLLLGDTGLYLIALRTWNESVTFLLRCKQLHLGLRYMEDALKSLSVVKQADALSTPEKHEQDSNILSMHNHILSILRGEVLSALLSENEEDYNWLPVSSVIESIVRIACMIKQPGFIWSELYPAVRQFPNLTSALFAATFSILKSLPLYGQLRTEISQSTHEINPRQQFIYLTPDMTKHFINWCLDQDDIMDLNTNETKSSDSNTLVNKRLRTEICLLRLHPSCLDLNYVVKLCWTHSLLDAYLHLYTDILMDFETPFRDLTMFLLKSIDSLNGETDVAVKNDDNRTAKYGHCLLVLLCSAFAGESFCHQRLPAPLDQDIPLKIFNLMLSESLSNVKSPPAFLRNVKYPLLHILLQYSPIDVLNLLTLSISDDEFFVKGELGQSRRQRLYYCLILTSLSPSTLSSPTSNGRPHENVNGAVEQSSQVNCQLQVIDISIPCRIFIFIIHQLSSKNNEEINIDHNLIYQLFERVCDSCDKLPKSLFTEFESAVIESIETGRLKHLEQCVSKSSEIGLYKVCEHIHHTCGNELLVLKYRILRLKNRILDKRNDHPSASVSIHSDAEAVKLASCIFQYLERSLCHDNKEFSSDNEQFKNLLSICFEQTEVLADWDEDRTLKVLFKLTNASISELLGFINSYVKENSSNQRATYLILRAYFKYRQCQRKVSQGTTPNASDDDDGDDDEHEDDTATVSNNWKEFLKNCSMDVMELYINLLICYGLTSSSDALLNFLESYDDYRVDFVLRIISVEKYPREVAYLYEKSGNFTKAMELYEQVIWFSVVDLLMKCEFLQNHPVLNAYLSGIFYSAFSLVITYLPPATIVSHILNMDGTKTTMNLKINLLVKKFISACQFEANQMVLNKRLAGQELTVKQFRIFTQYKCGFSNHILICSLCGLDLRRNNLLTRRNWKTSVITNGDKSSNPNRLVVFQCRHAFHEECLQECKGNAQAPKIQSWSCLICRPTSHTPVKKNGYCNNDVTPQSDDIRLDNPPIASSEKNSNSLLF
uniref:Vacuolar protein sorting-associated protein 8 central domain-containing protein n=1 Tax=Trichobilharzia regenti TaxID=157069 RepID=A0AA85JJF0_TRIRE|nr:unnamed protein product [Trichobilharzia regenti]